MSASSADPGPVGSGSLVTGSLDTGHLVRQYGWLLASRLLSAALQALILVLLARWAGPADFGVVASVTGVLLFLGIFADFGLSGLLVREHSRRPAIDALPAAAILRVNLVSSALLTAAVAIGLTAYALASGRPALVTLLPLAGWIAAEKNGDAWLALATAEGRSHLATASILLRRGLALLVFVGLARLVDLTLAYAVALAVGSLLANLVMRTRLRLPAAGGSTRLTAVTRAAWPFFLHSFATMIRNIDVAIVGAAAGPVAAGIYAVPSRLTTPLRMLPATLSPLIVRSAAVGTVSALRAISRVAVAVTAVMIGVLVVLALAAGPLVEWVLGPAYAPAVRPLQVICAGLVFAFGISLQTGLLQGRGREGVVGRIGLVTAVLIVVGLVVGARLAGPLGATIAASLSFAVQFLLLLGPTVRELRSLRR